MRHILLIILTLCIISGTTKAQNPGLLGKHYILHYNYDYQLNFFGDALYGIDSDVGTFHKVKAFFRGKHELGNEFVFSRWQAVQVDYAFAWGKDFESSMNFQTHEIALSYKKYYVQSKVSSIAPLGNYIRPKLFVTLSKYTLFDNDSSFSFSDNFMHYGASVEFGRQSILFKKVLLDLGISVGYIHYTSKEVDTFRSEYNDESGFAVLFQNSPYRNFFINRLFTFRIGFGLPLL